MQETFVSVMLIGLMLIAVPAAVCAGVIALIERKTPRHISPEGTAGTWRLGGTVGCALYYAVETLVTGVGDGTGLWAVGILYAWVCCGVPLAVAAALHIALRSGRTPRRA